MRLVMFDIDNTLLSSSASSDRSFREVLCNIGGFTQFSLDWTRYPHATGRGIATVLYEEQHGRSPTQAELDALREGFVASTRRVGAMEPEAFAAIPGARAFLEHLEADPHTAVALASGSWREAQHVKLRLAGLGDFEFPEAYTDDGVTREAIVKVAKTRALARYGVSGFEREVYVGDGVWDARTCRNLGVPLLGVGAGRAATRLREEGVFAIVPDFSDLEGAIEGLGEARVPGAARGPEGDRGPRGE